MCPSVTKGVFCISASSRRISYHQLLASIGFDAMVKDVLEIQNRMNENHHGNVRRRI